MSRVLAVAPAAARDIADARAYYARHELEQRFEAEIDRALELLAQRPVAYPVVYSDVRRALCRRFPYAIFFIVEPARVVVLAVHHQRRDPASRPSL